MEGRALAINSTHAELGLQVVVEIGSPIGPRVLPIESATLPIMCRIQLTVIR
jgi:hypothetical protein